MGPAKDIRAKSMNIKNFSEGFGSDIFVLYCQMLAKFYMQNTRRHLILLHILCLPVT